MSTPPHGEGWEHVQSGRATVFLGHDGRVPPSPQEWWEVRVRCDGPSAPLAPLRAASALALALLGEAQGADPHSGGVPNALWAADLGAQGDGGAALVTRAAHRVGRGLRNRLLGDNRPSDPIHMMTATLDRLADASELRCAIVFEAVQAADSATLDALATIASRPGWPRPAIVIGAATPLGEPTRALVDAVADAGGALVELGHGPDTELARATEHTETSPATRTTLRAAALVGDGFEAALVAQLLDEPETTVLARLQEARDLGLAVRDLGNGHFALAPPLAGALRDDTLPSLSQAWHRRLAAILHGSEPPSEASSPPQHGRSAAHLAAAGDADDALRRFAGAVAQAALHGRAQEAVHHAAQAFALLARLPTAAGRLLVEARIRADLGRMHGELAGSNGISSLEVALAELQRSEELIEQVVASGQSPAPPDIAELRADVRVGLASVCFDRGDTASLERALLELTEATRELLDAGQPQAAAALLNDQAAVWVRLGDPVRSAHLLGESRRFFESLPTTDPLGRIELAETLHLLARLPLHVPARPGMEQAAIDEADRHARDAQAIYADLGAAREQARVDETRGLLALTRGDLQAAHDHLVVAYQSQVQQRDAIGQAATTNALAATLCDLGQYAEALRMVSESIRLNGASGSLRGLAHNREAVQAISSHLFGHGDPGAPHLSRTVGEVERQLARAESRFAVPEVEPAGAERARSLQSPAG